MADESGDIHSKAWSHTCRGISCFAKGFPDSAQKYLTSGADYSSKIDLYGWNAVGHHFLGDLYFDSQQYERAKHHYQEAVRFTEQNRWLPSYENLNRTALQMARVANGEPTVDPIAVISAVGRNRIRAFEGWVRRYAAETLLHLGKDHAEAAESLVREGIAADERNEMILGSGLGYTLLGKILHRTGDAPGAADALNTAVRINKECTADGFMKKAEQLLREYSP
jgi:tetratricopeptide (TPR) repeat protein